MYIATIVTKRSSREIIPQLQFVLHVTKHELERGSVIEIIDGNKKSPAFIYNTEPISAYKQQIRAGEFDPKKLKFSKTGEHKDGHIMCRYEPANFKKFLDNNDLVKASTDEFIRSFFPKKKKRAVPQKVKKAQKATSFGDMNIQNYFGKKADHHSRMHEQVDTIRKYFGEKAVHGQGSFSYYLGFFKKISNHEVDRMFQEAKRSNKPLAGQKKLFWWKVGQYVKKDT